MQLQFAQLEAHAIENEAHPVPHLKRELFNPIQYVLQIGTITRFLQRGINLHGAGNNAGHVVKIAEIGEPQGAIISGI